MNIKETIEAVSKLLDENLRHSYDIEQFQCLPAFTVHIDWGDWKHEHLYAKHLIEESGLGIFVKSEVTDDDGSDCYSATHYFVAK